MKKGEEDIKDPDGNHIFALFTEYQHDISFLVFSLLWSDDFAMFVEKGLIEMPYADDYFLKATDIPLDLRETVNITNKAYCLVGKIEPVLVSGVQILYDVTQQFGKEALANGVIGEDYWVKSIERAALIKFKYDSRPVQVFLSNTECRIYCSQEHLRL